MCAISIDSAGRVIAQLEPRGPRTEVQLTRRRMKAPNRIHFEVLVVPVHVSYTVTSGRSERTVQEGSDLSSCVVSSRRANIFFDMEVVGQPETEWIYALWAYGVVVMRFSISTHALCN